MFALIFWPHVTIFCIFWLHECLKWILEFNLKSLFWCQSRQIFEVRAIEQRHHEFQLIHMPPHQFWPRYHSNGLSPVHVRFEFFPKQICNVEALICHFYKNIKTLTQIHFPRDAHIFRTCTIFYRHYKGLHQMRKDLVLCAHVIKLSVKKLVFQLCVIFVSVGLATQQVGIETMVTGLPGGFWTYLDWANSLIVITQPWNSDILPAFDF